MTPYIGIALAPFMGIFLFAIARYIVSKTEKYIPFKQILFFSWRV